MKLTFIYPSINKSKNRPYPPAWTLEPLAFSVLAGITPEGIDIDFFDDRIDEIPKDHKTDAVFISVEAHTAKRSYDISKYFSKCGIPVVLGGYHPTLYPEEACLYSDAIVVGEAEGIWDDLLADLRSGSLKKRYQANGLLPLSGVPQRNIYNNKDYFPMTLIEAGRGCSFSCNYCCISSFYKSTYRPRSISDILKDVQNAKWKHIFFIDDNIAYDINYTKELFRALIPYNIKWNGQAGVHIAKDDELLSLMEKSGCVGLLLGLESLQNMNLRQMNKFQNLKYSFSDVIRKFRDHGVAIFASFVFGYDSDNRDSIEAALDLATKEKTFYASFNHLIPYPGTAIYKILQDEGRLLFDKWWLSSEYRYGDVVFRPKLLTPKELAELCLEAKHRFFSYKSILRRIDTKTNSKDIDSLIFYLKYNLFFNKEVNRRQGLALDNSFKFG